MDQRQQREYERLKRRIGQTEVQEDEVDGDSGTWTPVFAGTTIAGTFTYTANRAGVWRRLGDLIYLEARIAISAIGPGGGPLPTGNIVVSGVPYAASATPPASSLAIGQLANINTTAAIVQLVARIEPGASVITLGETFDNVAAVDYPAANFTNAAANLILAGWYRTDS